MLASPDTVGQLLLLPPPPVVLVFPQPRLLYLFSFFLGVAVSLHDNWVLLGSGVTKSISADDSHLLVDVPSDYPKRITCVDPGGVHPEMGIRPPS